MTATSLHRALALAALTLALGPLPAGADWATHGVPLCRAALSQPAPVVVPDGGGGAIVGWIDARSGYNTDVYAQRVLGTGAIAGGWPVNGARLTAVTCSKTSLVMAPDDSGGAFLAWADDRCSGPTGLDIYALRVTASGAVAPGWPANGLAVCTASGDQLRLAIRGDGAGGAFIAWDDRRGPTTDVYVTRVLGAGSPTPGWPADGLLVGAFAGDPSGPALAGDGAGGAYVAWESRAVGNSEIYVQRLGAGGEIAGGWPAGGVRITAVAGDQSGPRIAPDGGGGAYVAWTDRRNPATGPDIYLQRLQPDGTFTDDWFVNGTPVCTEAGSQLEPALAADGAGGALLAWTDGRSPANGFDLYAQRMLANAAPATGWPGGGLAVCAITGDQGAAAVVADGAAGMLLSWSDARHQGASGMDLYLQRLTAIGARAAGWPADGERVCGAAGDQRPASACGDGAGGALLAWADPRDSTATGLDVWAHHFSGDGPPPTRARDLAASRRNGQTFLTWTTPSPVGWTWRVYASGAPLDGEEDLAQATLLGSVGDSSWLDRRLFHATGVMYGFCTDSGGAPLDSTRALFVHTPATGALRFYAVTAQLDSLPEDRGLTIGDNSLASPLTEVPGTPRPVYQRTLNVVGRMVEIHTLWVGDQELPGFPAMANRASVPYDFGLVRPGPAPISSLLVRPHWRAASFLDVAAGTGIAGEWVLALDDWTGNSRDINTYWYGYHRGYDLDSSDNSPPDTGLVVDYTLRRASWTVEWALRTFGIDSTRVYAQGYSLGGVGATMLAFARPDRFAAVQSVLGKFDFSFVDEPDTTNLFNLGGSLRNSADRLWGEIATDLPCSEGLPVYERLDGGLLAGQLEPRAIPPIVSVNGTRDNTLGWLEKILFFQDMNLHRQGGYFYWDPGDHTSGVTPWAPMADPRYLYRFRTNLSFPAISNCSADHDPGQGESPAPDSLGTINGFVEWDTVLVDQPAVWRTTLWLRTLSTTLGSMAPPESCTADVTPRRTQQFRPAPGTLCRYYISRVSDGSLVRTGLVTADSLGRVTVPAVKLHPDGRYVLVQSLGSLEAGPAPPPRVLALAPSGNPVRGAATLTVSWPRRGNGTVELVDVSGRIVRRLWRGPIEPGSRRLEFDAASVPAGLYFALARDGHSRVVCRLAVIR